MPITRSIRQPLKISTHFRFGLSHYTQIENIVLNVLVVNYSTISFHPLLFHNHANPSDIYTSFLLLGLDTDNPNKVNSPFLFFSHHMPITHDFLYILLEITHIFHIIQVSFPLLYNYTLILSGTCIYIFTLFYFLLLFM